MEQPPEHHPAKRLGLENFARGRGLVTLERAIDGIKIVIVLPLSLKQSVDRAPSLYGCKYNFAVREYNFAVRKYNFAVRKYNFAVSKYNFGVAAVEEPGHVPPASPQQLLHAVAEEPGTRQHFYK